MKKFIILPIIVVSNLLNAQSDTIVSNNEKIPCTIKEITLDAVNYSVIGENLVNSLHKNMVQKIIFQNGRIQSFPESAAFKKIEDLKEFDKVNITQVENEVKGLFKLGEASSKAKGTTLISNQERVKERAYRKFKIQAAMQGGNCIYLVHQRTAGNFQGGPYQMSTSAEASLTGVVYSNELPNFENFKKLINGKSKFIATQEFSLHSCMSNLIKCPIQKQFTIYNLKNENGFIIIEGKLDGVSKYSRFRVVSFTEKSYTLFYEDKDAQYNIVVNFN